MYLLVSPQSTAEGLEPALRQQKAFHSPLLPVELHKLWGEDSGRQGGEKTGGERQGAKRHLGLTWEKVDGKRAWGARGEQQAQSPAERPLIGAAGLPRQPLP